MNEGQQQAVNDKVIIYEEELKNECYKYGWCRAESRVIALYEESLHLKHELSESAVTIDALLEERSNSLIYYFLDEISYDKFDL